MARKPKFQRIMAGFVAFIMIGSVFGIILGSLGQNTNADFMYNDFPFTTVQGGFMTEIEGKEYTFYNPPYNVEDVNISQDILSKIQSAQAFYLVFDPGIQDLASTDLVRFELTQHFTEDNRYVEYGITDISPNYPQITKQADCRNASQFWPVILFEDAESSSIYLSPENQDCIVVDSANYLHRIKFRDALFYRLLGIIEG